MISLVLADSYACTLFIFLRQRGFTFAKGGEVGLFVLPLLCLLSTVPTPDKIFRLYLYSFFLQWALLFLSHYSQTFGGLIKQ